MYASRSLILAASQHKESGKTSIVVQMAMAMVPDRPESVHRRYSGLC
ncbi:MAG: hypothetical protein ACJASD_003824 [Sphingomonas echinoides]|jgi:hypothetical protein